MKGELDRGVSRRMKKWDEWYLGYLYITTRGLFTLCLNAHPMRIQCALNVFTLDAHWHSMRIETGFAQTTSGGGLKWIECALANYLMVPCLHNCFRMYA